MLNYWLTLPLKKGIQPCFLTEAIHGVASIGYKSYTLRTRCTFSWKYILAGVHV